MKVEIEDVLNKNFVLDLIESVCGKNTDLIIRPESFMVRKVEENDRDIHRIIILPPRGFTADKINQTNSHDEAEYATIEIKGGIKKDKNSYSVIKNCLLVASIPHNGAVSSLNKPYMEFELNQNKSQDLTLKKYSAGMAPFAVVQPDGEGFYHNLINLTDDWLVLKLYKKLRPQKKIVLENHTLRLPKEEAIIIHDLYNAIIQCGDEIFYKVPNLIENIVKMPLDHSLPALCEMLFVHDSGRHEACSVFAIIIKIGKLYPDFVISHLQKSLLNSRIPPYYATQLIEKITRDVVYRENRKVAQHGA